MHKTIKYSLLAILAFFLIAAPFENAHAQKKAKLSKEDKKKDKMLKATTWATINIEKGGDTIDINKVSGEAYMTFYVYKEKRKKGKKKKKKKKRLKVNKWKFELGGNERIFDYEVKGDSIRFIDVVGWNDFKIINLDKDRLTVEQLQGGSILRWNMQAKKKPEDY